MTQASETPWVTRQITARESESQQVLLAHNKPNLQDYSSEASKKPVDKSFPTFLLSHTKSFRAVISLHTLPSCKVCVGWMSCFHNQSFQKSKCRIRTKRNKPLIPFFTQQRVGLRNSEFWVSTNFEILTLSPQRFHPTPVAPKLPLCNKGNFPAPDVGRIFYGDNSRW